MPSNTCLSVLKLHRLYDIMETFLFCLKLRFSFTSDMELKGWGKITLGMVCVFSLQIYVFGSNKPYIISLLRIVDGACILTDKRNTTDFLCQRF